VKGSNTCPYCGIGRNFDLDVKDWSLLRVTPSRKVPVDGSHLCVKGCCGYDFALHHPVDAARIGLNGRTRVRMPWRRWEVTAEAVVDALDPPAKIPESKAVRSGLSPLGASTSVEHRRCRGIGRAAAHAPGRENGDGYCWEGARRHS
jgi:hypothetical protein